MDKEPNPTIAPGSQSQVESSQGCNTLSQPAPSIAPGSQVGTSQNSQIAGQPDPFDDPDPDEYVGVNDEDIYFHDDNVEAILVTAHEEHIGPDHISEDEEAFIDDAVDSERVIVFGPENPKIEVGALFPDRDAFKKSLRHFAIKNEFEVKTVKSDKTRFIGKCKCPSCPWRIHASILQDEKSFMVKVLPHDHSCPSTTMVDGKMASSSWVSDRVGDWLRKNPSAGAMEVKNKLEDEYHVKVSYGKAWSGRRDALDQIHGSWEESFQFMYNFKGNNCAEVSGMDSEGKPWRHAVELDRRECTCREWQLTGKPCMHAIAFICQIRGACMEDYVHEYFSIAKFRVAYEGVIRPMTDKSQWVKVDPGFKVDPPQMKRPPGRPRKERIPGCLELRTKRQKCKRCKQFGHQERTCKASISVPLSD